MRHVVTGLPMYIPHDALKANSLPYAGEVFDEPEEGDQIWIEGNPFVFDAEPFQGADGQWFERFGWFHL